MTDTYEQTIEVKGVTYYYDPDYDCYYRRYTRAELGHWDSYGWIYTIVILTVICASITYLH
jgi:hypothetical protein